MGSRIVGGSSGIQEYCTSDAQEVKNIIEEMYPVFDIQGQSLIAGKSLALVAPQATIGSNQQFPVLVEFVAVFGG